jgi:transmembrane sensor
MKQTPNNHEEALQKAERIAYLIAGHLQNKLTIKEADELDEWILESDENLELFEKLTDEDNIEAGIQKYLQVDKEKANALIKLKRKAGIHPGKITKIWPYMVAASILLLAGSLYMFKPWINKENITERTLTQRPGKIDIKPGSDRAVLTLSNGRSIILDSTGSGLLANEGDIKIRKLTEGEIIYDGTDKEMKYNVVSTPRGGQYKLILGDGSQVWLNAESSIKFPAGFGAHQREVELSGEAYFEVAKNEAKPFKVKIVGPNGDGGTVEVLGTHFNINSYADEGIVKTTLLEGSVQVERNGKSRLLKPGEQALTQNDIKVIKTDVNQAVAWKEGKFLFHDETIHSIGEQLKRWYDVEVEYQVMVSQHFNTEISRNAPLKSILDALEGTGQVHFTLEGKKLIIKP